MTARAQALDVALLVLGAVLVAEGLWMLIAPGSFFDALGPFGARNDHYTRDGGTFTLATGIVAVAAARVPSWRTPVLGLAGLWFAFHAVNHAVDIGEADPKAVGVFDFVALAAVAAGLSWLAVLARREER